MLNWRSGVHVIAPVLDRQLHLGDNCRNGRGRSLARWQASRQGLLMQKVATYLKIDKSADP
jgi:hypothetical protein